MALTWWRRLAAKLMNRAAKRGQALRPRAARVALCVEPLEPRVVFNVTPALSGSTVTFTGGPADNLYLTTTPGGVLEWSTTDGNFTSNLDANPAGPAQALTLAANTAVQANVGGTVYLESMPGAAGTFTSSGPLVIDANAVLASGTLPTGGSQSLTFAAPSITAGPGAQILANTVASSPGNITLTAAVTNTSLTADGSADITITGATLSGKAIAITATSTWTPSNRPTLGALGAEAAVINGGSHAAVTVNGGAALTGTANVTVTATSKVTATADALAKTQGGSLAVDGAVATSIIDSSADTSISGSTTRLSAGNLLTVSASNTATVTTTADGSGSGANAAGASVAVATVQGDTAAEFDGGASATANQIALSATSSKVIHTSATSTSQGATSNSHDLQTEAQGYGKTSDGDIGVAGAVAVTDLLGTTQAYVSGGTLTTTAGAINIVSTSANNSSASADGSNTGSAAVGVGVAVAVNIANLNNNAYLDGATSLQAPTVSVKAVLPSANAVNRFAAQATAGAGGASKVGVAGALAVNVASDGSTAGVNPSAAVTLSSPTTAGPDITFLTTDNVADTATAQPATATADKGPEPKAGVGAALALNVATNPTGAAVGDLAALTGAHNVTLSATGNDTASTTAEAGSKGGTAVTPVVAIAVVNNTTGATLGLPTAAQPFTVSGAVSVTATHTGNTATSADASAVGSDTALGAAIAVTVVQDITTATTSRDVSAGGAISFVASGAGASSAAATASTNGADASAQPAGQQSADGQSDKQLTYASDSAPDNQEASGAEGEKPSAKTSDGKMGIAAALGLNLATSTAQASVPQGIHITAGGVLTVKASNDTDAAATADASAASADSPGKKGVQVGAAVALNLVKAQDEATVGQGAVVNVHGLTVQALMNGSAAGDANPGTSTFSAQATSGASDNGGVGVAGSLALNLVTNDSQALIEPNAQVSAGAGGSSDNVSLTAQNTSASTASGSSMVSGKPKVGIGASVAVDIVTDTADAQVQDGVTLTGAHNVTLSATSANTMTTTVEAGGAGGESGVGVGASVAIAVASNESSATLGSWPASRPPQAGSLTVTGNFSAAATHTGATTTTADGTAAGGKVGIGAAIAVTVASDTSTATTAWDISAGGSVTFKADNASASSAGATAGVSGAEGSDSSGGSGDQQNSDSEASQQEQYASATAPDNQEASGSEGKTPSAKTSDGKVGIAAALGLNLATSSAQAFIPDKVHVTAGGALLVHASNDTDAAASGDGRAANPADKFGVGVGVAINVVNAQDAATIGKGAVVSAHGVTVEALANNAAPGDKDPGVNTSSATATSGASATKVGVAGSLALSLVTDTSAALIEPGAQVSAGSGAAGDNVSLTAVNNASSTATANASVTVTGTGGTSVGVGASVALNIVTATAHAEVQDGATLTGGHTVTLSATESNAMTTAVVAGGSAAGSSGVGIGASVAISVATDDSVASLGSTPAATGALTLSGNFSATAVGDNTTTTTATGTAAGNVGIGAAIAVTESTAATTAATYWDITATRGTVSFSAQARGGTSASATASSDGEAPDKTSQSGTGADGQAGDQTGLAKDEAGPNNSTASNASPPSAKTADGKVGIAAALGLNLATTSAEASIQAGRHVTAGGLLQLTSRNETGASATADGSAVNTKTGVGVGVAINVVNAQDKATIGQGAVVKAQGVTLDSVMDSTADDQGPGTGGFSASATAGAGATNVGVAGAVALNLVLTNTSAAQIQSAATAVTQVSAGSGDLSLSASNTTAETATATAKAKAGKVGIGASVALNILSNTADAEIQVSTQLGGANNATVSATSTKTITTSVEAGAAGGVAVSPAVALVIANGDATTARVGSGNTLTLAGSLTVSATETGTTVSTAGGDAAGNKVAVGAAVAINVVADSATATLARSVTAAGTVSVTAQTTAASEALATAGANGAAQSGSDSGGSSGQSSADGETSRQIGAADPNAGTANAITPPSQSGAMTGPSDPSDPSSPSPSGEASSQGGGGGIAAVGVAAAIGVNVEASTSTASIAGGLTVQAGGALQVTSTDETTAGALGTGKSVNSQNGVAAGVSLNVVMLNNKATVGTNATLRGAGITITALEPLGQTDDFRTWALAGAGAQDVGLSGAVGVNVILDTTQALLGASDQATSTGGLTVKAQNDLSLRNIAASAAFGGSDAGVGIAGAVNVVVNKTTASVGANSVVNAADALTVQADASVLPASGKQAWEPYTIPSVMPNPLAFAAAGALSGGVAVAGSATVNVILETTKASLGASAQINTQGVGNADQNVTVKVSDTIQITDGAGGISGGGDVGVGAGLDVGVVLKDAEASIDTSATVYAVGSVRVTAFTQEDINSLAVEAAAGGDVSVAGSFSVYVLTTTTTEAAIDDSATVKAQGDVFVAADASETIDQIAGDLSVGGEAGVGVANTTLVKTDNVTAHVGQGANVTTKGSTGLSVTARASENVTTIAVGGAVSGLAGVAGSATVNVWNETTHAYIDAGATVHALGTGGVALLAIDSTTLFSTAGALAGSGVAGVGAGVAVGALTKDTQAYIATATVTAAGDVTVQAESSEALTSIAAAAAIAGIAAVGVSAGVFVVGLTTRAFLGLDPNNPLAVPGPTSVTAQGNVLVAANDATQILGIAGNVSASGAASVGAAAAVPVVNKTTEAFVGPGASVSALALGGALTADTGLFTVGSTPYTGSAVAPDSSLSSANLPISNSGSNPLANPRFSADRTATPDTTSLRGVAVTAVNQDDVEVVGGSAGISGGVAVNIAGAVDVLTTHTRAYVAAGAQVNANNAGAGSNQSVLVAAGDDYSDLGIAAGFSVADFASVTPNANVAVVSNTTNAYVADGAAVSAVKDIVVRARGEEDLLEVTAAAAGSLAFSASGAVSVISLSDHTDAFIGNNPSGAVATATAGGNILIDASDDTHTYTLAGGLGVGLMTGGFGGAAAVTVLTKDTEAFVGSKAVVNAAGNSGPLTLTGPGGTPFFHGLAVQASSSENVLSVAAAAGGGLLFGLAGGVSVELITSTTQAYIGANASVDQSLSAPSTADAVNVAAQNKVTVFAFGGGLAGGLVGVAGGIDVGIVRNDTAAYIGAGATVSAPQSVAVNALSTKNVQSYGLSGAGGAVALAGSISVWAIDGAFGSGYSDGTHSADSLTGSDGSTGLGATTGEADGETGNFSGILGKYGKGSSPSSEKVHDNLQTAGSKMTAAAPRGQVSGAIASTAPSSGTSAYIGAGAHVNAGTVNAAGSITVAAAGNITFNSTTGSGSVGLVGIGGAIAIASFNSPAQAYIDANATVSAGASGAVTVNAARVDTLTANAFDGQAGLVALGAEVTVLNDNSSASATLGAGATIARAGAVQIQSSQTRTLTASATGTQVGGLAAGIAVSQVTVAGPTAATVGAGAHVGGPGQQAVGSLSLTAVETDTVNATAEATAAGIGAGSANVGMGTITPDVTATLATGAVVSAAGDVVLSAQAHTVDQVGTSGAVKAFAGVGVSDSTATVSATVTAAVQDRANITAGGSVTVEALNNYQSPDNPEEFYGPHGGFAILPRTYATATGSLGALLGGSESLGTATSTANVGAQLGNSAVVSAAGDANFYSLSCTSAGSEMENTHDGGIAQGTSDAVTVVVNANAVSTGTGASIHAGGDVTLATQSTVYAPATADGCGKALISIGKSEATSDAYYSTETAVGAGTTVTAGDTLSVQAQTSASASASATVNGAGLGCNVEADATAILAALPPGQAWSPLSWVRDGAAPANAAAQTEVDIGAGASLSAPTVNVTATVANLYANATATATADDLGDDDTANTTVGADSTALVQIEAGATLTGAQQLTLTATHAQLTGDSNPFATSNGFGAETDGNATNVQVTTSAVNVLTGAQLASANLALNATTPTSTFDTGVNISFADIDTGNASHNRLGVANDEIVVAGHVTILSATDPELVIDASGNVQTQNGVTFTQANGVITVNNIDAANLLGTFSINTVAPTVFAESGNLQNLSRENFSAAILVQVGTVVDYENAFDQVTVVNHSSQTLQVNDIQPQDLTASAPVFKGITGQVTIQTEIVDNPTQITIQSAGPVTLEGKILNPLGGTAISASAGDIQSGAGALVETNALSLAATAGAVGSPLAPVAVELLPANGAQPSVTVTAHTNVYLDVQGSDADPSGSQPLTLEGSITAGGAVNVNLTAAPAGSTFDFGTLSAGGPITLTAADAGITAAMSEGAGKALGVRADGPISITAPTGSLLVGTITSTGNASVSLSAPNGSIQMATGGSLSGGAVSLTAGKSLGTATAPLALTAATLTASAGTGVYATETTGDLNLEHVGTTSGGVTLTATSGSILDAGGGTRTDVVAGSITLKATKGSIGTAAAPVTVQTAGALVATAGTGAALEAVSPVVDGVLIVTAPSVIDVKTAGDLHFTEDDGNLNVGAIQSTNRGTVSLTASAGSIVNAAGVAKPLVTGGAVSLTAAQTVGTAAAPLPLNATALTASAVDGVFASEAAGNLQVTSVLSTLGDVTLDAIAGSITIKTIRASEGTVTVKALKAILDGNAGKANDILAHDIVLTSTRGTVGTATDPFALEAAGALTATALTGVFLKSTGPLHVQRVSTNSGNVALTVTDPANTAADLVLLAGGTISDATGTITLKAANGIETDAGSVIKSGSSANPNIILEANTDKNAKDTNPFTLNGTLDGKVKKIDG